MCNAGLKTQNWKNKIDNVRAYSRFFPNKNFAVFENPFLHEYYTQRGKKFTTY